MNIYRNSNCNSNYFSAPKRESVACFESSREKMEIADNELKLSLAERNGRLERQAPEKLCGGREWSRPGSGSPQRRRLLTSRRASSANLQLLGRELMI